MNDDEEEMVLYEEVPDEPPDVEDYSEPAQYRETT